MTQRDSLAEADGERDVLAIAALGVTWPARCDFGGVTALGDQLDRHVPLFSQAERSARSRNQPDMADQQHQSQQERGDQTGAHSRIIPLPFRTVKASMEVMFSHHDVVEGEGGGESSRSK